MPEASDPHPEGKANDNTRRFEEHFLYAKEHYFAKND